MTTARRESVLYDGVLVSILGRVIAEPGEDVHRLVYADRLEELGEGERAEFIRLDVSEGRGTGRVTAEKILPPEAWPIPLYAVRNPGSFSSGSCDNEYTRGHTGLGGRTVVGLISRGFVGEVRCTAEAFLAHADELVWHETQTTECSKCGGDGSYEIGFRSTSAGSHEYCARCGGTRSRPGTGRIPRPLPPRAQPIRKVVLTTEPDPNDLLLEWDGVGRLFYCKKFGGVEFELPGWLPA